MFPDSTTGWMSHASCLSPFKVSGMAIFTTACPKKPIYKTPTGSKENKHIACMGLGGGERTSREEHTAQKPQSSALCQPGLQQAGYFGMLAHISGHPIVIGSQDKGPRYTVVANK